MLTDTNVFRRLVISSDSTQALLNKLNEIKITHFIIDDDRYFSWKNEAFDTEHLGIFI